MTEPALILSGSGWVPSYKKTGCRSCGWLVEHGTSGANAAGSKPGQARAWICCRLSPFRLFCSCPQTRASGGVLLFLCLWLLQRWAGMRASWEHMLNSSLLAYQCPFKAEVNQKTRASDQNGDHICVQSQYSFEPNIITTRSHAVAEPPLQ